MTITRVQNWTVANKGDGSGSTVTNTLTSVPTAGNLLVACLSSGDNGGAITVSSFDDNIGDGVSWEPHPNNPRGLGTDFSNSKYRMYYKTVGTPSGGGKAVQCTVTGTQALQLFVAEYGIASGTPAWAVDGTPNSNVGLIGLANSGNITTAGSDTVVIGFSGSTDSLWGAGSGYTRQVTSSNWASDGVEDRFVTSANTYAVDWTSGGTDGQWAAMGIAFRADAGGTAYTLTAANGTYSLSGQAATLLKSKTVAANNGSYTLAGQAATLQKTRILIAAQGAYSLAGQAATLLKSKLMTAANGAYSLAGQAATLTYTAGHVLVGSAGSYSLAGQSATLLKTSVLSAQTGSLSLAGQNALLHYTGSMVIYDTHDGGEPRKDRYREDKQNRRETLETAWQREFHPVVQAVKPIVQPILTHPVLRISPAISPAIAPLNDEDEEEALWLLLA